MRTDPRTGGTRNGRNEDDDEIDEVGGYLQSETHLTPRLDLVAAARLDRNSRLPSAILSPRAAIVFKPGDSQTWRLSFNRAFETINQSNLVATAEPNLQDASVTPPLAYGAHASKLLKVLDAEAHPPKELLKSRVRPQAVQSRIRVEPH